MVASQMKNKIKVATRKKINSKVKKINIKIKDIKAEPDFEKQRRSSEES